MSTYLAQYVTTKNDVNGNPRRGWIVYTSNGENLIAFVLEGYKGKAALREAIPNDSDVTELPYPITVTPGEYRKLVRDHGLY